MTDDKFELTVIIVGVIVVALALTTVLVAALHFAAQPNWTQLDCIRAGFDLIEGNCMSPY